MITELFYSHDILNMKRGSLYTKSFRRYASLFLDTDKLKIALRARKVSGAFEKQIPAELKCNWLSSQLIFQNQIKVFTVF